MRLFNAILFAGLILSTTAAIAQEREAEDAIAAVKASVAALKAASAKPDGDYFRQVAARRQKEADFRGKLKDLGLSFKRSCAFANNALLDNSYFQIKFLNPEAASGGYAAMKVRYHPRDRDAFGYDYIPMLRIYGDPRAADFELRTSSIEDFLARTRDLADLKAKILELKRTVGPAVAAEDDRGDCSGEGLEPVPIETP